MSSDEVKAALQPLVLSDEQLIEVSRRVLKAMELGLNPHTKNESSLKMIPTFVRSLPTGAETGKFLALDLGGTNFRVLMITLDGTVANCQMQSETYAIDKQQMIGPSNDLFDYIAECLKSFITTHEVEHLRLALGFTFSFPCDQLALTSALLIKWTKGFKASGAEGQDVVRLLEAALIRKGVKNIEVCAVLNDTTGTLMATAYHCNTCLVGLILGTGTNSCYVENLDNVLTWTGVRDEPNQVIINTEWGAFGDAGELDFITTEFDNEIDSLSLNPKFQLFEKMISGMYLGEIMRVVLVSLINKGLLFNGANSPKLAKPYDFATKYVSEIESLSSNSSGRIKEIFVEHVDGSLYRFHPNFKSLMEKKITELIPSENEFFLMLSEDGSGRGAALVAAVASHDLHRKLAET
uniref:Phosphotransferase n=1 Tax=Strigamia maritima TaxID=126957 RepID=T1JG59_STRMM